MKIIILEDERHNAERLIQLLQKCVAQLEILTIIESVEEGIKWFGDQSKTADLIFMDIQLSDGKLFELLKHHEISPVIFTTAMIILALQAFKVLVLII